MDYEFGETAVENKPCLETIRALHQTVVALRAALEQSRSEILELKQRAWPVESVENALKNLSIENHVLRNAILRNTEGNDEKGPSKNIFGRRSSEEGYETGEQFLKELPAQEQEVRSPKKHVRIVTPATPTPEDSSSRVSASPPTGLSPSRQPIDERIGTSATPTPEGSSPRTSATPPTVLSPSRQISGESKYPESSSPRESIDKIENISSAFRENLSPISEKSNLLPGNPHPVPELNLPYDSSTCKHDLIEISIAIEKLSSKKVSRSWENLTLVQTPEKSAPVKKLGISKTLSFSNIPSTLEENPEMSDNYRKSSIDDSSPRNRLLQSNSTASPRHNILPSCTISFPMNVSSSPNISQVVHAVNQNSMSRNSLTLENAQSEPALRNASHNDLEQNEEVDDIELIFTTEETKDSDFKEELVPIETSDVNLHRDGHNNRNLHCPASDFEQSLSDRELEDDVFNETESQENSNAQSHPYNRENSQLYNSKSDNSINHEEKSLKSYYSYQDSSFENKSLEKDESFDRFEERIRIIETDISKCGIVDVEYVAGRRNTCPNPLPYRPIIHREALGKGLNTRKGRPILSHSSNTRRESGAQTDISALPSSSWRSESSLAHKVKVGDNFTTLPSKFPLPGSRLRLSEKTNVEARRVLLSDIGFTSMVPELSRSADHLCPGNIKTPLPTSYGQFLRTPDLYSPGFTSQKFTWTATTASPSEVSQLHSRFGSLYPLMSPPAPSRRFSAPVSPSRRVFIKPTISKVRFANGSLPELRSDWSAMGDSGDSTDSLVEEAENYLRRSIDCIVTGGDVSYRSEPKSRSYRRASAPEPSGDNVPPQDWQPFLPRTPRDLHLDHWVKVIVPEGRVRGGRVRYVGPLLNQTEQYVGVQLSTPDGHSDGTYNNRRYFNCEPYHGIFVPFKKVVMGWRP